MTKRMKEFKAKIAANKKIDLYNLENKDMFFKKKDLEACEKFLKDIQKILEGRYEIVGSCNDDISRYLIPIGTKSQVTYYGKPEKSFRISDHWNWYANTKKCSVPDYVQCESVDIPSARERIEENKATLPRKALQIAIQGTDGKYHHVFGYKWIPEKKCFEWKTNDPMDICTKWGLI